MRPEATRRQVFRAASGVVLVAVGAAVTACTDSAERPETDPDVALRAAAVAREQDLLRAYDALLLGAPADAALLTALRAEHAAHLAALDPLAPMPSPTPAAGSPAPDRAALRAAERSAAAAHGEAAVTARRTLAGLLASLSASESAHLVALG